MAMKLSDLVYHTTACVVCMICMHRNHIFCSYLHVSQGVCFRSAISAIFSWSHREHTSYICCNCRCCCCCFFLLFFPSIAAVANLHRQKNEKMKKKKTAQIHLWRCTHYVYLHRVEHYACVYELIENYISFFYAYFFLLHLHLLSFAQTAFAPERLSSRAHWVVFFCCFVFVPAVLLSFSFHRSCWQNGWMSDKRKERNELTDIHKYQIHSWVQCMCA